MNSNYKILRGNEITYNDIKQAIEIDNSIYPKEYRGNIEICSEWYKKNPNIYTFVKDVNINRIIGYSNIMPLNDKYFNLIKSGNLNDLEIPSEGIETYSKEGIYKACLTSIIIAKDYQNTDVIKYLYEAIIDYVITLSKKEVYFSEMIAEAISNDGRKFCKFIGMKNILITSRGTAIYKMNFIPPEFEVLNSKCGILKNIMNKGSYENDK